MIMWQSDHSLPLTDVCVRHSKVRCVSQRTHAHPTQLQSLLRAEMDSIILTFLQLGLSMDPNEMWTALSNFSRKSTCSCGIFLLKFSPSFVWFSTDAREKTSNWSSHHCDQSLKLSTSKPKLVIVLSDQLNHQQQALSKEHAGHQVMHMEHLFLMVQISKNSFSAWKIDGLCTFKLGCAFVWARHKWLNEVGWLSIHAFFVNKACGKALSCPDPRFFRWIFDCWWISQETCVHFLMIFWITQDSHPFHDEWNLGRRDRHLCPN